MTAKQRLIVFLLLGTGFMLPVDFSILNIALPQVGAAVGLGLSDLPWVATAYALPAAGFSLLFGRIADLYGRRRLFLTGTVKATEVLICLLCESRARVDELVQKAIVAGGASPNPKKDLGFMYGHGFEDLDGHVWELAYMDLAAIPVNQQ